MLNDYRFGGKSDKTGGLESLIKKIKLSLNSKKKLKTLIGHIDWGNNRTVQLLGLVEAIEKVSRIAAQKPKVRRYPRILSRLGLL